MMRTATAMLDPDEGDPAAATTRVYRKPTVTTDDLSDTAEAFNTAYNCGMEFAACLVSQDGHRKLAALIRRMKREQPA